MGAAAGDPLGDVGAQAFDDRQPRTRQVLAKAFDQRQRQAPANAGRQADRHVPHLGAAFSPEIFARLRHALQDLHTVVEQAPASVGEADTAAVAQQQRLTQVGLELTHLAAQCRLRDVEHPRRLAETAQLGHAHEALQVFEVDHGGVPYCRSMCADWITCDQRWISLLNNWRNSSGEPPCARTPSACS